MYTTYSRVKHYNTSGKTCHYRHATKCTIFISLGFDICDVYNFNTFIGKVSRYRGRMNEYICLHKWRGVVYTLRMFLINAVQLLTYVRCTTCIYHIRVSSDTVRFNLYDVHLSCMFTRTCTFRQIINK